MKLLATIIVSYLLGGVLFSYWVGRLFFGVDIRETGSGNLGATNLYRAAGPFAAFLGFTGDALKGSLAVVLAQFFVGGNIAPVLAAVFAILGHTASPFNRLRGGKAVATAAGAIVVLTPIIAAILALIWTVVLLTTGYVSLASIVIASLFPILVVLTRQTGEILVFSVAAAVFVIYKHRDNISRLRRGEENKIRIKK